MLFIPCLTSLLLLLSPPLTYSDKSHADLNLNLDPVDLLHDPSSSSSSFYLGQKPEKFWESMGWIEMDTDLPPRKKPSYLYSTTAIRRLAGIEEKVVFAFRAYLSKIEERAKLIRDYLEDYEQSSVNSLLPKHKQIERDYMVAANPIVAHRLVRRFALDFDRIARLFAADIDSELVDALNNANPEDLVYPSESDDYKLSLTSLLRIQQYSNLNASDMAAGKLGHLETSVTLSEKHAFDIGVHARQRRPIMLAESVEWLELTAQKILAKEEAGMEVDPEFKVQVAKELEKAAITHDEICSNPVWEPQMEACFSHLLQTENYGPKNVPKWRRKAARKNQKVSQTPELRSSTTYSFHTRRNFISTCTGDDFRTPAEKSTLFCWYERKKHPYLTIAPFKFEQVSASPFIVQIYDLLSLPQIQTVINATLPQQHRSEVINDDGKSNYVSEVRTSQQAWVYDDHPMSPLFFKVGRKLEIVTGLQINDKPAPEFRGHHASEAWQIASYRTSHHYDEHLDALSDIRRTEMDGDRIATVMFYLTDVDAGGYTGFPQVGVAARPVGGSAMFWYNLWKNGTADERTFHGGCPVVHGVKWVMNKWILYNENFRTRPCSINRNE